MENMKVMIPVWSLFPDDTPGAKPLPDSIARRNCRDEEAMSRSCKAIHAIRSVKRAAKTISSPVACSLRSRPRLAVAGDSPIVSNNRVPENFVPNPLELPAGRGRFRLVPGRRCRWTITFGFAREQPVQNSAGIILDGRVETSYRIGASLLEPWRKDSHRWIRASAKHVAIGSPPSASSQCVRQSQATSLRWSCKRTSRTPIAANTQRKSTARLDMMAPLCDSTTTSMQRPKLWDGFPWDATRRWNRRSCKTFTAGSPNRTAKGCFITILRGEPSPRMEARLPIALASPPLRQPARFVRASHSTPEAPTRPAIHQSVPGLILAQPLAEQDRVGSTFPGAQRHDPPVSAWGCGLPSRSIADRQFPRSQSRKRHNRQVLPLFQADKL